MAEPHKLRARRRADPKLDRLAGTPVRRQRAKDLNVRTTLGEEGDDEAFEFLERSPERFRDNLQYLLRTFGVEVRQLAQEIGVEYRWLRRAATKGLERRVPRLDRLAHHFGLPDGHYFWAEDITRFVEAAPPRPEALKTWRQNLNWLHAERLLDLLESGRHDFLKALIERLHAAQFPPTAPATTEGGIRAGEPEEQAEDKPVPEEVPGGWEVPPGATAFCMPDPKKRTGGRRGPVRRSNS